MHRIHRQIHTSHSCFSLLTTGYTKPVRNGSNIKYITPSGMTFSFQGLPNPFYPCSHYPGAADRSCGSLSRVVLVEGDKQTMRPEVHQSTFCVCPESQPCSSSLGFNPALPVFQEERARKCLTLQYRHLIPAPVDQTSASTWFYKHP